MEANDDKNSKLLASCYCVILTEDFSICDSGFLLKSQLSYLHHNQTVRWREEEGDVLCINETSYTLCNIFPCSKTTAKKPGKSTSKQLYVQVKGMNFYNHRRIKMEEQAVKEAAVWVSRRLCHLVYTMV